jgi:hypothetical protein
LHLQVVKGVNGQGKSKYSRYLKWPVVSLKVSTPYWN